MRGGEAASMEDDTLSLPFECDSCEVRLDERICCVNCSGIAGLGGSSPSVLELTLEPPRSATDARSTMLGLRFLRVSGNCSLLDLGVDAVEPFFTPLLELAERPLDDFHDLSIDLRTLLLCGGESGAADGGRFVCCDGGRLPEGGVEGRRGAGRLG